MGWESSGVVMFDLGPPPSRSNEVAKLKGACNLLIICRTGLGW